MITNGNFFLPSLNVLLSKVIDFFVQSGGRSTNMQLVRSDVFLYNCGMTLSNICIGSMTFLWTMPGVNSIQELFGGWGAVFPRMIRLHSVIQWCSFLTQVRQFGQFLNSSAQNQDENKAQKRQLWSIPNYTAFFLFGTHAKRPASTGCSAFPCPSTLTVPRCLSCSMHRTILGIICC